MAVRPYIYKQTRTAGHKWPGLLELQAPREPGSNRTSSNLLEGPFFLEAAPRRFEDVIGE